MSFARLRASLRSLRFRLLVWNTLVVLVLILVCLLLVRQSAHRARFQLLDDFLSEELDSVCAEIAADSGRPGTLQATIDRHAGFHPRRKLFIQLLDEKENVRWGSIHSPKTPIPHEFPLPLEEPITWEHYRFQERRLPAEKAGSQLVRVGVALHRAQLEMQMITGHSRRRSVRSS